MSRQTLFGILRTLIGLALAAWAINLVLAKAGANLLHEIQTCRWEWLVLTILLTAVGTALSSYRWSSLLALQQVYIGQWEAFRLTMIGVFFNLFGFGGVGGDLLKMVYVQKHAGERTHEAVLSILVDRILGLLGLFVVALATLPFVWSDIQRAPSNVQALVAFVVLVAVVGGSAVTLVLARDFWMPAGSKDWIRSLGSRFPARLVKIVGRVVRSLDLYRTQLRQLFKALAISAVIHTLATLGVMCIGQAFRVEGLAPRNYFLAVQVANTVSAVPITPGGLGSRDLVLSAFFEAAGADSRRDLIPPMLSFVLVFWSLVGGLIFMTERSSVSIVVKEEEL